MCLFFFVVLSVDSIFKKIMKLNMGLGNSMATSVRSGIKLEGSAGTGSQISTITVVTAGGVGQTLVVQPVQQTSVVRTSIDQVLNWYSCICILNN